MSAIYNQLDGIISAILPKGLSMKVFEFLPGYTIREDGVVTSLNYRHTGKPKEMTPANTSGNRRYKCIHINACGVNKNMLVHRLVGEAFIPNPENKPDINHIDGDPSNNHIDNLEWNTRKENMRHARDVLGFNPASGRTYNGSEHISAVAVRCIDTGVEYGSMREASDDTGACRSKLTEVCKGRRKTTGGLRWEYVT